MQKSQPRILCSVLWLVIVAIIMIAMLVPTYRLNESFEGEVAKGGERHPATVELNITYHHDPFFDEWSRGALDLKSDILEGGVYHYDEFYFDPNFLDGVLYDPRFGEISAYGWSDELYRLDDASSGVLNLRGQIDMDDGVMLLLNDGGIAFAGSAHDVDRAAEIFDYLSGWFYLEDYFTENPFSHTPFIDRETAIATRTETPLSVLFGFAARDFLSDCWEYLLIGAVALVALILSHWFPQIYLNHWILDALHEGRSGAKKYLNHSRICFTAMGLVVPLFACLAHFFEFGGVWQFSSGNIFFVAMTAVIIALLVLLHRRAWIPITTQP